MGGKGLQSGGYIFNCLCQVQMHSAGRFGRRIMMIGRLEIRYNPPYRMYSVALPCLCAWKATGVCVGTGEGYCTFQAKDEPIALYEYST